jgi:lipoic acid synthetase
MPERKPEWLKIRAGTGPDIERVRSLLEGLSLNTVCEEAGCPNLLECFGRGTATFLILGRTCTRNCRFCGVEKGSPASPDPGEPAKLAQAVKGLGLRHVVVTSVTRDDLADGGASHFASVIMEIREANPGAAVEVLIPDFGGSPESLRIVVEASPEILNHNMETVRSLYPAVRPMAVYERSLGVLGAAKAINSNLLTKSGIMLGLGETRDELEEALGDLRAADCDFLTLGQYLAPTKAHMPVAEYIRPEVFLEYRELALEMGFRHVSSGPFVRSSYLAEEALRGRRRPLHVGADREDP